MEIYKLLDDSVPFNQAGIKKAVRKMWVAFYERLAESGKAVDRAVWMARWGEYWIAVRPESPADDIYDNPLFCYSVKTVGFKQYPYDIPEKERMSLLDVQSDKFAAWVRRAVVEVWRSPSVQRLHKKAALVDGRFGIYLTPLGDIEPHEFDEMKWIAGSKIHLLYKDGKMIESPKEKRVVKKVVKKKGIKNKSSKKR